MPAEGPRTRVVCTLGPSSRDPDTVRKMVAAGMNVARINSSHCDIEDVPEYAGLARRAGDEAGKPVAVMLDLQGPRLRAGPMRGSSAELQPGATFTITTVQKRGDSERVSVSYPGLTEDLEPGDRVLVDGGLIKLRVKEIREPDIVCEVVEGGTLFQGRGMNFPDSSLGLAAFTERDMKYLEAGLEAGVDWVAQSFVRSGDDLGHLKRAISDAGADVPVMAKVERSEALENIEGIIEAADGIMVARGDLGVEVPIERVALAQKDLIVRSLRAACPVVTATQMLESMVDKPVPTRAEASDVANAILDGTDAVMLSAETAIGSYPVRAVETISRIALTTEAALDYPRLLVERGTWQHRSPADAIGYAACKIAFDIGAKAIVTMTRSGYTARLISRYRPGQPLVAASAGSKVASRLLLVWGVTSLDVRLSESITDSIGAVSEECVARGIASPGDKLVVTGGFLDEECGTTNLVHIHTVGGGT